MSPQREKFSVKTAVKKYGTMPTSLRDAFLVPWIFPRPKKVSTGHFLTLAALGPAFQIRPHQQKTNPIRMDGVYFLAEKEGFEPSIPFWGIHDFQSCALGQLRDFSIPFLSSSVATDWLIIQHSSLFVNRYFKFFQKYFSTWKNGAPTPLNPATTARSPFTVLRTAPVD